MVPGALGAFRRKALTEGGLYDKDTLTEDFDTTLKVLKSGKTIQSSSFGSAYTQAPETLKDLYKQRMRWYRGNFQTVFKHKDALSNPRFGSLHRLGFPFVILHLFMLPFMSIFTWASAIMAIIEGSWLQVAYMFLMFLCLQALVATLAIQIDDEDESLILYSPFFVVGFKHLIDIWVIKALFDVLFRKNLKWTRARRVMHQSDRKPLPAAPSTADENLEKLASKRKQIVKFLLELRRSYKMRLISDESYNSFRTQVSEKLEDMERKIKKIRFDKGDQLKEIEMIKEEFPELHKVEVAKRHVRARKKRVKRSNEMLLLVFAGIAFLTTGSLFITRIYDPTSLLLFGVDMWILTLAFGVVLFLIGGVYASFRSSGDEDRSKKHKKNSSVRV